MVKLNIIVEGGVPLGNIQADTASNVESLRQSFYMFFSRLLKRSDINIVVQMGWGVRAAIKQYLSDAAYDCMFVDSDCAKGKLERWFESFQSDEYPGKSIIIPADRQSGIFFMIQEMEAWILKQPECLDRWGKAQGYTRKRTDEKIENHSLIRGKDIEKITKPSEKLGVLIRAFFEKNAEGKKKSVSYGKLKSAPEILDEIKVEELLPLDSELQRFCEMFGPVAIVSK